MDISKELNSKQMEAVSQSDGYLLVLAGAGSGKTRVLTYKVAWLIGELKVKPWELLAVTFTNKAAEEMKTRVEKLIGGVAKNVWMGTFHSFCARVLRKYGDLLGYSQNFTIYDADDSKNLIKRILKDKKVELKLSPKGIAERISKAKNSFILPEDYTSLDFQATRIQEVYRLYRETLKSNNAMDFDDLLVNALDVFSKSKEALEKFSFKYILVDEYQDTNRVQYELIKLLSVKYGNLTVVGDEDQSIYGFRGANIGNILHFEHDFSEIKIIRLEENYRSTKTILKAASQVVRNNTMRLGKELWTTNKTGDKITIFGAQNGAEEAKMVVNIIKEYNKSLRIESFNDFVVLYRTNAQSRVIEEALRRDNMPYTIVGGVRFYERREIKDILAYLRILVNPYDFVALHRIINVPPRGIGEKTLSILTRFAEQEGISIYSALRKVARHGVDKIEGFNPKGFNPKGFNPKGIVASKRVAISKFYKLIKKHKQNPGNPATLIKTLLNETGYLDMLNQEGTIEAESRIENLNELIAGASEYETLTAFLESVSLLTNIDEWDRTQPSVALMTAHNAKGLEFPIVFITGLEEGLFPHSSSLYDNVELEEERRLFYVSLTRAKEKVYLSYAHDRKGWMGGLPSRFLDEIPVETKITNA